MRFAAAATPYVTVLPRFRLRQLSFRCHYAERLFTQRHAHYAALRRMPLSALLPL